MRGIGSFLSNKIVSETLHHRALTDLRVYKFLILDDYRSFCRLSGCFSLIVEHASDLSQLLSWWLTTCINLSRPSRVRRTQYKYFLLIRHSWWLCPTFRSLHLFLLNIRSYVFDCLNWCWPLLLCSLPLLLCNSRLVSPLLYVLCYLICSYYKLLCVIKLRLQGLDMLLDSV